MKKILFFITLSTLCYSLQSQVIVHLVSLGTANKTAVEGQGSIKLRSSDLISPGEALVLKPDTEIYLKDSKGRFCILKTGQEERKYSYNQVIAEIEAQQNKGLLSTVFDFVQDQIKKKPDIRDVSKQYIQVKGGVSRGVVCNPLKISPLYKELLPEDEIRFIWRGMANSHGYRLTIYKPSSDNKEQFEIYSTIIQSDTTVVISSNLLVNKISENDSFMWAVCSMRPEPEYECCTEYIFNVRSPKQIENLKDDIDTRSDKEESEEYKYLIKAALLEEVGLFQEAKSCYEYLKTNYTYQKIYDDLFTLFIARTGMIPTP